MEGDNADQTAGIKIVARAIQAPLRQIAENAGVDGAVLWLARSSKTATTALASTRSRKSMAT